MVCCPVWHFVPICETHYILLEEVTEPLNTGLSIALPGDQGKEYGGEGSLAFNMVPSMLAFCGDIPTQISTVKTSLCFQARGEGIRPLT